MTKRKIGAIYNHIKELDKPEIIHLYLNERISPRYLALKFGVAQQTIRNFLKKEGIKIRGKTEGTQSIYPVKCKICNKEFIGRINQIFCSSPCFYAGQGKKLHTHLSTATTGTISELKVGIDLLDHGFEVFKALSPACSCDLVALKSGKVFRLEVKTGTENHLGTIVKGPKVRIRAEYLVTVTHKSILYEPKLY